MNDVHVYGTKHIYTQLHKILQFRLHRIEDIDDFFVSDMNQRENLSKILDKYIAALGYAVKNLLVLSSAGSVGCISSFTTVIGALVKIAKRCINLVFPCQ